MKKNNGMTLVALVFLVFPGLSAAGDADTGKVKAKPCMECHYADDFAGESVEAIQALIQGTSAEGSEHPGESKGLSEEDLADIAAFFARGE